MSDLSLAATTRTEFGKGAARRIRRAHQIPAVLYSHGSDPLHISLPGHETMLALKHANALLTITLDGAEHLAIAKDVQRDPVRAVIEHVDLLTVKRGEKIAVDVQVRLVGEPAPGAVAVIENQTLHVEAEATHLPESLEVDIEGLEPGASVRVSDLSLPAGTIYLGEPDDVVVNVTQPQLAEEGEETEAAETAEGAETEGAADAEASADEAAEEA